MLRAQQICLVLMMADGGGSEEDFQSPQASGDHDSDRKPGRPKVYNDGWRSVQSSLYKSLRLEAIVYDNWCSLKIENKWQTISAFARYLLHLYKEFIGNADKVVEKLTEIK